MFVFLRIVIQAVDQFMKYIMIHRVQPSTQKGYLLVAHTAFSKGRKDRGFGE